MKGRIFCACLTLVAGPVGAGPFNSAASFPAGDAPVAIVAADFNRDGYLDFATANNLSTVGMISVSLGSGHGGFAQVESFLTNAFNSIGIAAGDFNGDGNPDLAVLNTCAGAICQNGSLSILLGNGDGTFQDGVDAITYDIGITPTAVAVGDLNGDGHLDLVATSASSGTVSVLLCHGDGSFDPAVSYSTGRQTLPNGVVLGDLDGDHNLDVIVANGGVRTGVVIFLGNGDGTLGSLQRFPLRGESTAVTAGDFNGDGKLDVAVTSEPSPNTGAGTVTILLGDGQGGLQTGSRYTVGAKPSTIVAIDFDGDGALDLAVANPFSSSVSLLRGKGNGKFAAAQNFTPGDFPEGMAAGDVNGDDHPDLLVVNSASDDVSLFSSATSGAFRASRAFPTGEDPHAVATGDFNHDGNIDVAVVNLSEESVSIYFGDGQGGLTFSATYTDDHGQSPGSIAVADVNGDGNLDLLVGNTGNKTISLFLGASDGTFESFHGILTDRGVSSVATGDFNHDGKVDLVAGLITGGAVELIPGNGDGSFQLGQSFQIPNNPASLAVADLNSDGNLDVAVVNFDTTFQSNSVSVLLGDGAGGFLHLAANPVGRAPISISIGDLNNDGILDLAVANLLSNSVSQLIGNGDGTFQPATDTPVGGQPVAVIAADFNGDGKCDLAVSVDPTGLGVTPVGVGLALNDGTGLPDNFIFSAAGQPGQMTAADFRSGGGLDLAIISGGESGYVGSVSVLVNTIR